MKITKQRLKEIIREELSTVRENDGTGHPTWDTQAPDSPFNVYNLEAENEKGIAQKISELAADVLNTNLSAEDASLWDIVKDAITNAGMFDKAEQ